MQSYVGLDVSDKETSVCVMSDRGKILWQGKVLSDPQMLAEVIKRRAPKVEAFGLETGSLDQQFSLWLLKTVLSPLHVGIRPNLAESGQIWRVLG